jgi:hypothetical protein
VVQHAGFREPARFARRSIAGTFSLTCQGTPPVRQWRTGGLHTGPTPRNAHGTLLAAVVPTRRRHGPDRPYDANGGQARRRDVSGTVVPGARALYG